MIKIENTEVWGFEHAIRGMRNPMNSWEKSDSKVTHQMSIQNGFPGGDGFLSVEIPYVGENDMALMRKLFKGGPEHRKYLRQIFVAMDITAPLYWWKEFDTYKVGTAANSCSTMHKIASKEFTLEDFSIEHLTAQSLARFILIVNVMNFYRQEFNETKSKEAWWQMIQLLPTSYNQKRTVTMSYENVMTIIRQRTGHKLDEWNQFCDILRQLPCVLDIMGNTFIDLET